MGHIVREHVTTDIREQRIALVEMGLTKMKVNYRIR